MMTDTSVSGAHDPESDILVETSWVDGPWRIGRDELDGNVVVSTVNLGAYLGIDPLYETLIFGGPYDQDGTRYTTLEAAQQGHAATVANLRAGRKPLP